MQLKKLAAALIVAGVAAPAFATDGYFQPGYSVKSVGMGGVGIAYAQDALAAAANPAGMVEVGSRFDAGLSVFMPNRSASLNNATNLNSSFTPTGSNTAANGNFSGNDNSSFLIPEFGYNRMLNPNMSVGLSVYGNGGMNVGYGNAQIGPFMPGTGGDLQQLFISPSFAWKINAQNEVGVAVNLVHQTFRINGLDCFAYANCAAPTPSGMSVNSAALTGNGHDSSDGVGVRLGWIGHLNDSVSVGATYQPKTHMGSFSKYSGLFAGGGSFDIPANYGVGFAWKTNDQLTIAGDVMRIMYGSIPSLANGNVQPTSASTLFGAAGGAGFGWSNITVIKLGASYQLNPAWTVRAGYNHTDVPVPSSDILFNTLAPAVVKDHLTLGFTYALNKNVEISGDYLHAFKNSVSGQATWQTSQTTYTTAAETLSMSQDEVGLSLGYKF